MADATPPPASAPAARRVGMGAVLSAAQTVVTALVLFGLYRFVRGEVGVAAFGVWSLVVGTTVSASLAEFGMAGAALRFVAHALGQDAPEEAAGYAETAVLTSAGLIGAAALVLYLPLALGLGWFLRHDPAAMQAEAQRLLPVALVNIVLSGVTATTLGALDGVQRVDARALLAAGGSVLMGVLALVLVPHWGLLGFTLAQTGQALVVGAVGWTLLRRSLPSLRALPVRWHRPYFRTLIGYGARWQAVSLLLLLADPATKALAKLYGGLSFVGDYEFASKVATQIRGVLASAYLALTPHLTRTFARAPEKLGALYVLGVRAVLSVVLLVLPAVVALAPLAGLFWSGTLASPAAGLLALLFAGWCLNLLAVPAYIDFASRAQLGALIVSHAVYAAVNVALGWALGRWMGGMGVALAVALAHGCTTLTTAGLYAWRVQRHQSAGGLGRRAWGYDAGVLAAGLAGGFGLAALVAWPAPMGVRLAAVGVGAGVYGALALGLLWRHPLRRALAERLHIPVPA